MHLDYANIVTEKPIKQIGIVAGIARLACAAGACVVIVFLLAMLEGIFDQPHPDFGPGRSWVMYQVIESCKLSPVFTVGFVFSVAMSFAVDYWLHGSIDARLFLSLTRFGKALRFLPSRLIFLSGGLGVIGYLVSTQVEFWEQRQIPCGMIWPPERFFVAAMWMWCVVWLGETIVPPRRPALVAAIIWSIACLCLTLPLSGGWIRE
jgi:hypothetical protein